MDARITFLSAESLDKILKEMLQDVQRTKGRDEANRIASENLSIPEDPVGKSFREVEVTKRNWASYSTRGLFKLHLDVIREKAHRCGMMANVCWTPISGAPTSESDAVKSSQALLELAHSLGDPNAPLEHPPLSEPFRTLSQQIIPERDLAGLAYGLKLFWRLLRPSHTSEAVDFELNSCETAYYEDRETNRLALVYGDRLFAPEAMHGVVSHQKFPKVVISHANTHGDIETSIESNDRREELQLIKWPASKFGGGLKFRTRERVRGDVLVLRFRWRTAHVVAMLSLRKPELPHTLRYDTNQLQLASRYLVSWLESLPTYERTRERTIWRQAIDFVPRLGEIVRQRDWKQAPLLERALSAALNTPTPVICHVHLAENNKGVPGLRFREGSYLVTREGKPRIEETPWFSLVQNSEGYVEQGISAQAAAWKTPIFIKDMLTLGRTSLGNQLLKLDVPDAETVVELKSEHAPRYIRSQLAYPFFIESNELKGVVSIQHPEPDVLCSEHVERVGLLLELFTRIYRTENLQKSSVEDLDWIWQTFCSEKRAPSNGFEFLRELGIKLRTETKAALVYTLVYDTHRRVFMPCGISGDSGLLNSYSRRMFDRFRKPTDPEAIPPGANAMTERAMVWELIPNVRGGSWKFLKNDKPHLTESIDQANFVEKHASTKLFRTEAFGFEHRVALRLDSGLGASPEGVVWLLWTKEGLQNVNETCQLESTLRLRIENILRLVATIWAVRRRSGLDIAD